MAKKVAKKVKKKVKQKQKQKQKQSQRTSVTVNINTKSKTKKAPRATNGNTNRVLQQFAQPIITLPSNLINPPPMPQYGLNPSQLQARRNDGEAVSMGQRIGQPVSMDGRLRAGFPVPPVQDTLYARVNNALQNREDPYEQSLSGYPEPEKAYTASLSSGFSVDTSSPPSSSSSSGLSGSDVFPYDLSSLSSLASRTSSSGLSGSDVFPYSLASRTSTPVRQTNYNLATPPSPPSRTKKPVKLRIRSPTELRPEPNQSGIPKAGNPSLSMLPQRPETTQFFNQSIPSVEGKLGDY